jgi:hypothetical protein
MAKNTHLAIDPMSMILSGSALRIWYEKKHPHVPKVADIQAIFRSLAPSEQKEALNRAKRLVDYGKAVEQAIDAMKR